jgi:DNA polymerase I-like protein with 3'-5' exonuclease and polymerase domains
MKLLLNTTVEDRKHRGAFASIIRGDHNVILTTKNYDQTELLATANRPEVKADAILCNNPDTLKNLVPGSGNPSDWRGSILRFSVPVLCIAPLHHIHTVQHGEWLHRHDLRKLACIHHPAQKLRWTAVGSYDELRNLFSLHRTTSLFLVIDIETDKFNQIDTIGFTFFDGEFHNYVVPFYPDDYRDSDDLPKIINFLREYLSSTDMPKCFHNGAYDNYYLLRYDIACRNYIFDTEYMWYCWFSELNKSLAFVSSMLLYDTYYWKEEGSGDRYDRWKYCAKDCWYTARCLIQIIQNAPPWVWRNYAIKFPEVFSAINVKFFGFNIDQEKHGALKSEADAEVEAAKAALITMADEPDFNPGSWQQVSKLLYDILGAKKPARRGKSASKAGTDETTLKKIALQHPLIERFVDYILKYRQERKAVGTYYNAHQFHGRLKFAQNIDGTTTGRHSSNALPLYIPNPSGKKGDEANYGTQIQNIPRYMRKCLQCDPGYILGEVDKKQSEARYTAYMSQDLELIRALESGSDFYIYSTKRFFGIELDPNDPTLHDKGSLRQITKKIIHGTNYMMGAETFIDAFIQEIGFAELRAAQALLGMEKVPLKDFAAYLLGLYHKAYPKVEEWWNETKKELIKTNRIITPDGWTRLFFGDVRKDHKRLRDAVAHQPQHQSVAGINRALYKLLQLQIESGGDYILMAQIHDSIIFQAKEEKFDYYMIKTQEAMTTIEAIHGRSVNIPLETSFGRYWNPMIEWKEAA